MLKKTVATNAKNCLISKSTRRTFVHSSIDLPHPPANPFSKTKNAFFFSKTKEEWIKFFEKRQEFGVLGVSSFKIIDVEPGKLKAKMQITEKHMAPNGYLHAAMVVLLADTATGFGCYCHLPSDKHAFTTGELKTNFISSASVGDTVYTEAILCHAGLTTQVWDAKVYNLKNEKEPKLMALFRNTQILLNKDNSQTQSSKFRQQEQQRQQHAQHQHWENK